MSSVSVFVEARPGATVVTLRGSADMGAAADIDRKLDEVIASKPKLVIVDLNALSYMNSITIGSLVRTQQALKSAGGQLRLANPSPYAAGVLTATKVGKALPVFPTLAAAMG
jgi:anti-anti-sigma factor